MAVRPIFLAGHYRSRPLGFAPPDFGVAGGYLAVPGNLTFANEALSTFGGAGVIVAESKGEPPYLAISGVNYDDVAFGTRALYSGRDKTLLVLFWANSIPSSGADYGVVSLAKNDYGDHNIAGTYGAISISTSGMCRIGDYDGSLQYGDCGTVTAGKWHCAVGTVKSGVRIAGALDGKLGVSRSIGTATLTDGSFLRTNVVDQVRYQVERFPGRIALVACWNRAFSDAELVKYSANPWLVFRKLARTSFFLPAASGAYSLTVQDSAHGHSADALTLFSDTAIAINDAAHGHAADSVALYADMAIAIADAAHSHSADNLALSTGVALSVGESTHGHTADAVTLSASLALLVADATHGHAADNIVLDTASALAVDDSAHAHTADGLVLSIAAALGIQDAAHGHTADALTLSAALALIVADAAHGHAADSVALDTGSILSVADALHGHAADSPALSAALALLIDDATHGHGTDAITLTTALSLVIAEAMHAQAADNADLVAGAQIAVQEANHSHTAESLTLSQAISLAINDALHTHAADAAALTSALTLAIAECLHAHGADNIVWPGQSATNLLRVASVYVRLMGQRPSVRIKDNTEYLRIGNAAQTVRTH